MKAGSGLDKIRQGLDQLRKQQREKGYDPFGMEPDILERFLPLVSFLYYFYHRVEVHHAGKIPDSQAIYVANHSGQIPIDALMITFARGIHGKRPFLLRSMIDYWVPQIPFIGSLLAECGGVVGTADNFRELVRRGESVLVFPEGMKGINKSFFERYQILPFGKGFMRLAMESGIPVVPVAVIGAEEQYIQLGNFPFLAKLFRLPVFPVSLTFPLLGLIGAFPAPTKYHLYFGSPMVFRANGNGRSSEEVVEAHVKKMEKKIKALLKEGLAHRKGIFF